MSPIFITNHNSVVYTSVGGGNSIQPTTELEKLLLDDNKEFICYSKLYTNTLISPNILDYTGGSEILHSISRWQLIKNWFLRK